MATQIIFVFHQFLNNWTFKNTTLKVLNSNFIGSRYWKVYHFRYGFIWRHQDNLPRIWAFTVSRLCSFNSFFSLAFYKGKVAVSTCSLILSTGPKFIKEVLLTFQSSESQQKCPLWLTGSAWLRCLCVGPISAVQWVYEMLWWAWVHTPTSKASSESPPSQSRKFIWIEKAIDACYIP